MRKGETERIKEIFSDMNLQVVDAKDMFMEALKGLEDPEEKRKALGEAFIRAFEKEARELEAEYLIQGTIYPDRIEPIIAPEIPADIAIAEMMIPSGKRYQYVISMDFLSSGLHIYFYLNTRFCACTIKTCTNTFLKCTHIYT